MVKLYQVALEKKRDLDVMIENMYNYYKKRGESAKQKEMLLKLMECTDEVEKWYLRCKEELTKEEFVQQEPHLIEIIKKRDRLFYLDLCIEKGQFDQVLAALQERTNANVLYSYGWVDQNHRYSRQLSKKYPDEILALYWNEVKAYVGRGKRENYYHAVKVLHEIHSIMKTENKEEAWRSQYQEFCQIHKRKRLLIEALQKF